MTEPTIISTPDTCGGEPRIAGRRITVWDIATWLTIDDPAFDKSDAAIASAYHDLRAEEVAAARLWLQEHPAELAAYRERQTLYERVSDDPDWAVDELQRLRTREAALVALLERTQPFLASYLCNGWQEGDKLSTLEREIEKALAADPSAPVTTEERS